MFIKNISLTNLGTINQNQVIIAADDKNGREQVAHLYFSYETIVGIDWHDGSGNRRKYTHENDWSMTTGKLLNKLEPDKKKRVERELFLQAVDACFAFLSS